MILGQAGAWCAAKDHIDRFQYLQIDLGKRQKICRVATQGMAEFPIWVTEYTLEFGNNGHIWADYTENGREKVLRPFYKQFLIDSEFKLLKDDIVRSHHIHISVC